MLTKLKAQSRHLNTIAILYFIFGLIFACLYAYFYHWGALSYFSPGFYMVLLTWPVQLPGLFFDFQFYGLMGKTLQ